MKQEQNFEEYLMEKYPALFYSNDKGEIQPADCGIGCPKGWRKIVDALCESINRYVDNEPQVPHVYIGQIKSKFGGLRFYYDGGDDVVRGMVRLAEVMCDHTCETTGARGSLHKKGSWYVTASDSFAKEQNMSKIG